MKEKNTCWKIIGNRTRPNWNILTFNNRKIPKLHFWCACYPYIKLKIGDNIFCHIFTRIVTRICFLIEDLKPADIRKNMMFYPKSSATFLTVSVELPSGEYSICEDHWVVKDGIIIASFPTYIKYDWRDAKSWPNS